MQLPVVQHWALCLVKLSDTLDPGFELRLPFTPEVALCQLSVAAHLVFCLLQKKLADTVLCQGRLCHTALFSTLLPCNSASDTSVGVATVYSAF